MIASIQGIVQRKKKDSIVVSVQGLGLQVFAPIETISNAEIGKELFLFTAFIVRQDAMLLFGFTTEEELEYFELLIGANGVGPKIALAILSTLNPAAIRRAVASEEAGLLSRVPGVGKKTAQKILLHLQGKVPAESGAFSENVPSNAVDFEVLEALTALGYSLVQAQAAVQSIPKDTPGTVEDRIRAALQSFG